ncbi:efflux RND transporter periplasmic adaptor subunit [Rhodobacteraceae bacterium D3-12]|nr:efflux RND transporter periplasmic adaptor subunit [Rhodobacteraceae bacterium D3-12]
MRFMRQSLTGLLLLSLTMGALLFAANMLREAVNDRLNREARVPQARERVFAVNVVTASTGQEAPVLTAYGEVQSRRTLDLRAAVGGTVVMLADDFVEGGQVTAGQLLVRIDPADAQAALDRAASDVQDSEAEKRDAARALALARDEVKAAEEQAALRQRAFERQVNLKDRGVGTDAAVEEAELTASSARAAVLSKRQALATAEARVDQAATNAARALIALNEAKRRLADTEIRAGFSGTLSEVSVLEGGLVSTNEQLARVVDQNALEVAFRLSTQAHTRLLDDNGRLRPADMRATLDVYGIDMMVKGKLSRDSAAVGEGQTGRLVFAQLEAGRGLKPGDFVTVEIDEAPLDGVIRLPSGAYGSDGTVLVLDPDGRLEAVEVELVRRQGDDVIVRANGLDGREVVTARTPLLGPGIKVKPLRAAGAAAAAAAAAEPEMLSLSQERRAKLVAFVEGNTRLPEAVRSNILAALSKDKVPARMVKRIEARMGG